MTKRITISRSPLKGAAALMVGALVASGCSFLPFGSDEETVVTTEGTETPATVESEPATTVAGSPDDTAPVNEATWDTDPQEFRDQVGVEVTFECAAGGSATAIWGVEVYTDDSSVCTAAVHVGLITLADGGLVTVLIMEPLDSYEAGVANAIESSTWGEWGGSFSFPAAPPGSGTFEMISGDDSWSLRATDLTPAVGDSFEVTCTPGGELHNVWGSGTYTADSSICSAAVHAGVITTVDGGQVALLITEGLEEYESSDANGVSSFVWLSYDLSFQVS